MLDHTKDQTLTTVAQPSHMPAWTWDQLEALLVRLAASPAQREMAPALVSATRKQSVFLPPEHVLLEVLCLACFIADEGTSSRLGEDPTASH
jgi:hypothetical protein